MHETKDLETKTKEILMELHCSKITPFLFHQNNQDTSNAMRAGIKEVIKTHANLITGKNEIARAFTYSHARAQNRKI